MQGQSPNPFFLMPCPVNLAYDIDGPIETKKEPPSLEGLKIMMERYEQSRVGKLPTEFFCVDASKALQKFGIPSDMVVKCPLCHYHTSIYSMIIHLNDKGVDQSQINSSFIYQNGEGLSFSAHAKSFKFIGEWLKSIGY